MQMNYRIEFDRPAVKFLQKQPKQAQKRILTAIQKLPFVGDVALMQGHKNLYRLRVGEYRVIYSVENEICLVFVMAIGNRGDIYKRY